MPIQQALIDPRFYGRIVWLWFNLANDTAEFESVAARERLEHIARLNA